MITLSCPNVLIGHPGILTSGFPLKDCGNDDNKDTPQLAARRIHFPVIKFSPTNNNFPIHLFQHRKSATFAMVN
ncbi:MAG: hypothetical protein V1698_01350 [bacterium]